MRKSAPPRLRNSITPSPPPANPPTAPKPPSAWRTPAPPGARQNLAILRNLQGDPAQDVRIRARVSLLLLGEPGMDTFLRDRLRAGDEQERRDWTQLDRLSGPQLAFFRQALEAIAKNPREPYLRELAAARPEALGTAPGCGSYWDLTWIHVFDSICAARLTSLTNAVHLSQ